MEVALGFGNKQWKSYKAHDKGSINVLEEIISTYIDIMTFVEKTEK
jgi:hypothetical protein